MAEIIFIYKRQSITIECDINKKMKDICKTFSEKINMDLNSLLFSYGANTLNLEDTFNKITKKNKIIILVKDINDKKISETKLYVYIIKNINTLIYFMIIL